MHTSSSAEVPNEEAILAEVLKRARRCARRSLSREDAEDLAQDIVLECLVNIRNGRQLSITEGLNSFVRTMVRRRLFDAYRANESRDDRDAEFMRELEERPRAWMSPEMALEEAELDEFYEATLASLPAKCRQVFLMVREEGDSYQAVANKLGITRVAVSKHVERAQKHFRAALITHDIVPPARHVGRSLRVETQSARFGAPRSAAWDQCSADAA